MAVDGWFVKLEIHMLRMCLYRLTLMKIQPPYADTVWTLSKTGKIAGRIISRFLGHLCVILIFIVLFLY